MTALRRVTSTDGEHVSAGARPIASDVIASGQASDSLAERRSVWSDRFTGASRSSARLHSTLFRPSRSSRNASGSATFRYGFSRASSDIVRLTTSP